MVQLDLRASQARQLANASIASPFRISCRLFACCRLGLSQSVMLLLFQECGDTAGLRKLIEKPVHNTIAIANLSKKALKPLLAADEKISAKLVHLYCMAVEFLGQPMTEDEMKAAFDSAHASDYDAMVTAKVFEAMLRFSDLQGD